MSFKNWTLVEKTGLFLCIPALLVLIFILPADIKIAHFILNPQMLSIESILLSNFVHSDLMHLLSNLLSYILVVALIMNIETRKETFYKAMAASFLVAPLVISFFSIWLLPTKTGQGFSGVVAALMGYYVYAVYGYVKNQWKIPVENTFIWLVFIVNVLVGGMGFGLYNNIWTITVLATLGAIFIFQNSGNFKAIYNLLLDQLRANARSSEAYKYLKPGVFVFQIGFLFALSSLVQFSVTSSGATNILGHYVGYVVGLVTPVLLIEFPDSIRKLKNDLK